MLIDWFTVAAQALNFLILVWLMKRFLYQPVLRAIDTRENRIKAQIKDADDRQADAKAEAAQFSAKSEAFDQQRAALLQKATTEAIAEKQRLLDAAVQAADALTAKNQQLQRDAEQSLAQMITKRITEEVFAIARKALTDLAAVDLEERMVGVFLDRLDKMSEAAKEQLGIALRTDRALVQSAFDLAPPQRLRIEQALDRSFAAKIEPTYATAPDLVSGIDLTAGGEKIGWSIADYLAALQKTIEPAITR
jgi:F-type H+-transporting ATPase subunit b